MAKSILLPGVGRGGGGEYRLPIASRETLGGIKVGDGLEIDSSSGLLSVISSDTQLPYVKVTSQTPDINPYTYVDIEGSIISLTPTFKEPKEGMTPLYFVHFVTGSSFSITLPETFKVFLVDSVWQTMNSDIWLPYTEYELVITNNICKVYLIERYLTGDYFRFVNSGGSNILTIKSPNATAPINLQYSVDGINFETVNFTSTSPGYSADIPFTGTLYLKGNNQTLSTESAYWQFITSRNASVAGVINSLYTGNDTYAESVPDWCYYHMFDTNLHLTNMPELPYTVLGEHCYEQMFRDCTSLNSVTDLPAETLTEGCYKQMFENCTGINEVHCNATNITAIDCTYNWLNNVANTGTFYRNEENEDWLVNNPSGVPVNWTLVPPIEIKDWFYFTNAGAGAATLSLTNPDNNTPVTLEYSYDGYNWTTWGPTSSVPITLNIPVNGKVYLKGNNVALGSAAGYNKFNSDYNLHCGGTISSLLTGDTEPLTDLTGHDYAYKYLFGQMTTLLNAPELPATTLSDYCYYGMFEGCGSLEDAPELPATELKNNCYAFMFHNCTEIDEIHCNATNISANNCTNGWVGDVSATGTFYRNANNESWTIGTSGIPNGWGVVPPIVVDDGWFCFEDATGRANTLYLGKEGSNAPNVTLQYSYDCITWNIWGTTGTEILELRIPANSKVYLRGTNTAFGAAYVDSRNRFSSTGNVRCGGVISSVRTNNTTPLRNLTGHDCAYAGMFDEMSTLLNAPELPATTLSTYCYYGMFEGCTKLTTAPALPATTLANWCYLEMFERCTSLTTAPELPATTLVNGCYQEMFDNCSNLSSIKYGCLNTAPSETYCNMWVTGVKSSGTFYYKSGATWNPESVSRGISTIPSGWTLATY